MSESSIHNPQSAIEPPPGVRQAYAFSPRAVQDLGVTAAGEIEEAVWRIVTRWNEKIPAKKVRLLNQDRFRECQWALKLWDVEDILAAIDFYGDQKWQQANRAWKRFENWVSDCTIWCEAQLNAAEAAQAAADRAARKAAELQAQVDQRQAQMRKLDALRRRIREMPADQQARLMAQAARDLPAWMAHTKNLVLRKACEILERAEARSGGE